MRQFRIKVNGRIYEVEVEEVTNSQAEKPAAMNQPPSATKAEPGGIVASAATPNTPAALAESASEATVPGGGEIVTAPLPGAVLEVRKQVGDAVRAGDVVLILEAMKMENEITTPVDGVVNEIRVQAGQTVNMGDVLVVIGA